MTVDRDAFYARLATILETTPEAFAAGGRRLPDDPDSVVLLDIMAMVDELTGVTLSPEELKAAKTAEGILELIEAASV